MWKSKIAPLAIALGALTACASAGSTAADPSTTGATVTANGSAPSVLQFTAPSVGGGAIDFTQFAGKPVVLWFWAPT